MKGNQKMKGSRLAKLKICAHTGNYTKGRIAPVTKITIHHMGAVASAEACGAEFQRSGRNGSANYGIGKDGVIAQYVSEGDTPWSDSDWSSNCTSVSIEVSNSAATSDWPVSQKSLESLIELCADIALRNGFGTLVKGKNLTWHSMYAPTACPGAYLLSEMDYICAEANKIIFSGAGFISGVDIPRKANSAVLYFKGNGCGSAGTNKWGYEVRIDKNGVALEDPHYSGNTPIPREGKVLSAHGDAGAALARSIKKGDIVWFDDHKICVEAGVHRSVDGVNTQRLANQLIVFKNVKNAITNKWGTEVAVDKNSVAAPGVYGVGKMPVPEGGFVLSGHGDASEWIRKHIPYGSRVTFDGRVIAVK